MGSKSDQNMNQNIPWNCIYCKPYFRNSFHLKNEHFTLIIPSVNLKSTRQGRCSLDVASFPPWRSSWRKMFKKTSEKQPKINHECLEKAIRNRVRILGISLVHFGFMFGSFWAHVGVQNDTKTLLKNSLLYRASFSTSWEANGPEKWPKYDQNLA